MSTMEKKQKTIIAVGAHTGDAQLTCGLLLAKHAMAGDRVVLVDLTAGERGTPPGMEIAEFRAKNVADAGAFAQALGGVSIVLDTPDGELVHTQEAALQLAGIMREYQADAVIGHWRNSMHKDHVTAHRIMTDAIFFASLGTFDHPLPPAPIRRTMYAENWEDAEGFVPYTYVEVTEAFPLWQDAVRKLWLTENSRDFKYLRYYDALSIMRGALIRKERAVAMAVDAHVQRQILEML